MVDFFSLKFAAMHSKVYRLVLHIPPCARKNGTNKSVQDQKCLCTNPGFRRKIKIVTRQKQALLPIFLLASTFV
jgi:hypothetical protein